MSWLIGNLLHWRTVRVIRVHRGQPIPPGLLEQVPAYLPGQHFNVGLGLLLVNSFHLS